MRFKLADQPRLHFATNPLKLVRAQIRFPQMYSLGEPGMIANAQRAIRDDFPIAGERHAEQRASGARSPQGTRRAERLRWRFSSVDGRWRIDLTPDSIALETEHYRAYEEFRAVAEKAFGALVGVLEIRHRTRVGLRYVDEITHPDAVSVSDWSRFLHDELLGIAVGESLAANVASTVHQVQLVTDEGRVAVRHGYLRETDGTSVYFIDLDAYDETTTDLRLDEVMTLMDAYKRWSWNFFRSSITDELATFLQPTALR